MSFLPADNKDAWSVAPRSPTFATWTRHWTATIPPQPLQPMLTSLNLLQTNWSWASPMRSKPQFKRTTFINWQPLPNNTICMTSLTLKPPIWLQWTSNKPLSPSRPPGSPLQPGLVSHTDFYPWLSSVLNGFALTSCDDPGELYLTLHAIPWPNHQLGLLQGHINWRIWKYWQFGREVNQLFDLLPRDESVQEVLFRSCSRHFRPTWRSCNNSTKWRTSTVTPSPSHWSRTSWEASLWK